MYDIVFEANKKTVFEALAKLGVVRVTVGYSGSGDSGQLDSTIAYGPEGNVTNLNGEFVILVGETTDWQTKEKTVYTKQMTVGEAVDDLCWYKLEKLHGGWENNSGGDGMFEFTVADNEIVLKHRDIVETYEESEHTF